jgi:hypothetical protein
MQGVTFIEGLLSQLDAIEASFQSGPDFAMIALSADTFAYSDTMTFSDVSIALAVGVPLQTPFVGFSAQSSDSAGTTVTLGLAQISLPAGHYTITLNNWMVYETVHDRLIWGGPLTTPYHLVNAGFPGTVDVFGLTVAMANCTPGSASPALNPPIQVLTALGPSTRNNFSGDVGLGFLVGGTSETITTVGRWFTPADVSAHVVGIYTVAGATVGAVTVNPPASPVFGFVYQDLGTPIVVAAAGSYVLASTELSGGDLWYDSPGTDVSFAGPFTGLGPYFRASGGGAFTLNGSDPRANGASVPVDALYI